MSQPSLFIKATSPQTPLLKERGVLFTKEIPDVFGTIKFRSLDIKSDLQIIHNWVNREYAKEYWQMNGPYSQLFAMYQCMEFNPYSTSFIGELDERLICQFDVYSLFADELKDHVNMEEHDCGFHLLMAPNNTPIAGLTVNLVKAFLEYYFSFPQAKRIYAEPDVNNEKSIVLLERCGFKRLKKVTMSYKEAYVYCLERQGSSPAVAGSE